MRKSRIFKIAGFIMLAAAIGLAAVNRHTEKKAGEFSAAVITELKKSVPEAKAEFSEEDVALLLPEEIEYPDYVLNPFMDLPLVKIEDYEYCGTVSIPSLSIELPVINEWSYPALRVSPCRYEGTPYLNNMIICAHNYSTHFGEIKNLSIGEEIYFTDNEGNVFRYRVTELETLGPWDSDEMINGNYGLTLFTCTIGGRTRVVVRCEKHSNRI